MQKAASGISQMSDVQCPTINSPVQSRRPLTCSMRSLMRPHPSQADLLEERLISFAATILSLASELPWTASARHIANQIIRSATAAAANYAEARGAESRADFVHKLGIVQKELNETTVWLELISRTGLMEQVKIAPLIAENRELCRIICASVRTVHNSGGLDR